MKTGNFFPGRKIRTKIKYAAKIRKNYAENERFTPENRENDAVSAVRSGKIFFCIGAI